MRIPGQIRSINKGYYLLTVVVAILVVTTLVWALSSVDYSLNAENAHQESLDPGYFLSIDQMQAMLENKEPLLVFTGEEDDIIPDIMHQALKIPLQEWLSGEDLQKLRDQDRPIILFARDMAEAAALWIFLKQMGLSDLYILEWSPMASLQDSTGTDPFKDEMLRYEFTPDASVISKAQDPVE